MAIQIILPVPKDAPPKRNSAFTFIYTSRLLLNSKPSSQHEKEVRQDRLTLETKTGFQKWNPISAVSERGVT